MEVNKYKRKFKLLFDKFFQENFELNSYYTDNLLKYLDGCRDKSADKILDTPFFSDLIIYSLTNLENASTSVKVFIMEVITIVLRNELQFSKLAQLDGFKMMGKKLCALHTSLPPTPLHLAGIKVALAQTTHFSGLMWLCEHKVWKYILTPTIHHCAKKVALAAYNFIAKLIWKLNEYDDEAALMEVLQFIVEPIKMNNYNKVEVIDASEGERVIYDPIFSYIKAILAIASDPECENIGTNKVIPLLTRYFIVEPPIHLIFQATRDFDMSCLLSEMTFRLQYAFFKEAIARNVKTVEEVSNEMILLYYNIVHLLLQKRMLTATIDFVVKCIVFLAKLDESVVPLTFERYGRTFDFKNQFIMLVLVPMLTHAYWVYTERKNNAATEALDVYSLKLSKFANEHIVKVSYSFKAAMESTDDKKIVLTLLREIFKLKGVLNVAQAGMVYQALFYTLELHVIMDDTGALIVNENENPLKTPDDVKLLSLVLEAIKMVLKEHNINWYENVEIICLQTTLMNLLKQNFIPTKQLLQAVDLIDLSIQKFLSPDMALLMESKSGSTLNEICNIMKLYFQHEEWEVRDSALHLLLSCTDVAFVKYIPLQKLLLNNNLAVLAANAALTDSEFYVQTTALRCLASATKIECIWKDVLIAHNKLYVQLIHMLRDHPEGIVRKEAANVLTEVYVNQKLTNSFAKCLFNVMTEAALNDLHWEVQLAALHFWKNAIRTQMSNRGMIYGKFPAVTFSKEKRKIITLNQKEIVHQLDGIMNDLSSIGCLTVLHKCLDEEFNLDVMAEAYGIAKELFAVLDRYKYEPNDESNRCYSIDDGTNSSLANVYNVEMENGEVLNLQHDNKNLVKQESLEEAMDLSYTALKEQSLLREKVIDRMLNTTQVDLILDIYEDQSLLKSNKMEEDEILHLAISIKKIIEPNKFWRKFKTTDYSSIIEDKKNWISRTSNLDTLLDEILTLGEVTRVYEDDCN